MQEVTAIIGAGQAGSWAAMAMRSHGYKGRIILIGDEAVLPYEKPPLSKKVLTAETVPAPQYFHPAERYAEQQLELKLGFSASKLDLDARIIELQAGERIAFDQALIATGGRARALCIPGAQHVDYLRTYADALHIRQRAAAGTRIVCVGGGPIGLECASSARMRDCEVDVIEADGAVMGRCMPHDPAREIQARHEEAGIRFHFGAELVSIERRQGHFVVHCKDYPPIACDMVIAGVGLERNLHLARDAGLATGRGILVDEYGRTNREGVWAAGDVAEFWEPRACKHVVMESWAHAQNHGSAVGAAIAGALKAYDETPWFWSDQFDLNIQVAGVCVGGFEQVERPMANARLWLYIEPDGRLAGAIGLNAARDVRICKSLIQKRMKMRIGAVKDPSVPLQRAVE